MSWGNITLTDKEFFTQMARFADVNDPRTCAKYWYAACEVIIRELFYNGTCRVPTLGTFTTKHIGESIQVQKGIDGKQVVYQVPPRDVPEFTPHDDMINDINMHGVTKQYRKRLKAGKLSKRDYERQVRAEILNVDGNLTEKRLEDSKQKFNEMLKEKKERFKGKVDLKEDED